MKLDLENFDKHDWNHMHDCILDVTWETTQTKCSQEELEQIFIKLPEKLQFEALRYGMNDTCWREDFMEFLEENLEILNK